MSQRNCLAIGLLSGLFLFMIGCSATGIDSLTVAPATQSLAVGQTAQLTATGLTTHGSNHPPSTTDVTDFVNWSSSAATVASVSATGLVKAISPGTATISASMKGFTGEIGASAVITVTGTGGGGGAPGEPVASLTIIPTSQTVNQPGQTGQYIAIATSGITGLQTDATSKVAWSSSNVGVATINATGFATATGAGSTTITAIATNPDGSVVPATSTFTVTGTTAGPLLSLAIIPGTQTMSAGQSAQLIAIGAYNTIPTSQNLTSQSTWSTSNSSVATVTPNGGLVTAVSQGTVVITAQATNPNGGVITGTATFTVSASASGGEPLASLAIVPASQTALAINQTAQFIAIGTTQNGTTVNLTNQTNKIGSATIAAAAWTSSNPHVATINSATGIATALSAGTTAIIATASNPDGTVVLGTAVYTVTVSASPEPLVSMTIVPGSQTLTAAGQPAQFIAIGTTSGGATVNLTNQSATIGSATINPATWSSSSGPVAAINPLTGLATAGTSGVTAITAVATNPDGTVVTGSATLTVNIPAAPEPLVSLSIVPAAQTALAVNQTSQFIAIGKTSTGATVNLTDQTAQIGAVTIAAAVWSSSNPTVATVNSATGAAISVSAGSTAITAIATNPDGSVVTGSAVYTVALSGAPEPLVSMAVVPSTQPISVLGQTADLTAIATTGTGSTVNLTNQTATVGPVTIQPAVWASSNAGVATVNSATGVVTAVSGGVTVVTAIASNPDGTVVTGISTVTVTATGGPGGNIASIAVIPGNQSVAAPGMSGQFIAIGTSATGATTDLTNLVAWSSSSAQIATVGAATGVATGVSKGLATITALYTPPSGGNVVTGTGTFQVLAGSTEPVVALTMYPTSQSATQSQQTQFTALGTQGATGLQFDVTQSVVWSSSNASVATIGTSGNGTPGLATGLSAGSTTIEATYTNPDGSKVVITGSYSVSIGAAPEPLLSINIVPSSVQVSNKGMSAQYLAFGTYSTTPTVRDLTNKVTWISLLPDVASIDSAGTSGATGGLATAEGYTGDSVIYAQASNPDGTVVLSNPQTFICLDAVTQVCDQPIAHPQFATITVFIEGQNTSPVGEFVTAPSDTGTPNLIHCGPDWAGAGGQVCTGTYETGSTIVLTENLPAGSAFFGGWSSGDGIAPNVGCQEPNLTTSTTCTVTLNGNASIGAIFY